MVNGNAIAVLKTLFMQSIFAVSNCLDQTNLNNLSSAEIVLFVVIA